MRDGFSKRLISIVIISMVMIWPLYIVLAANSIQSIKIDLTLHEDGSGTFVEERRFTIEKGTEHFLVFENLGSSKLLDFKVFDSEGKVLEDIGTWDVNKSLEEKAGKYGTRTTNDGLELCFGVSSLGEKQFTVEYTFSDVVRNLEDDYQAIYWQFINPDMDKIENIDIRIKPDFNLDFKEINTRIWGFGYRGQVNFQENVIRMLADSSFSKNEYVVLLTLFPNKPFKTSGQYSYTSENILKLASDGASLNGTSFDELWDQGQNGVSYLSTSKNKSGSSKAPWYSFIGFFIGFVGFVAAIIVTIFTGKRLKRLSDAKAALRRPSRLDEIYGQIPYNGNFIDTVYLLDSEMKEIIAAFIVKWLQANKLAVETDPANPEKLAKTQYRILDPSNTAITSASEAELWQMILEVPSKDGTFTSRNLNTYIRKNIDRFNAWEKSIKDESKNILLTNGLIRMQTEKIAFKNTEIPYLTPLGQALSDKIYGFKQYLLHYGHASQDVGTITDNALGENLIWASYLGVEKAAIEQIKLVDGSFNQNLHYYEYAMPSILYISNNVSRTQSSLNSSSGDGGSSFSGGGGGASGGGSGGGSR